MAPARGPPLIRMAKVPVKISRTSKNAVDEVRIIDFDIVEWHGCEPMLLTKLVHDLEMNNVTIRGND